MRLFRPWHLMRCFYPGALFRIKTPRRFLYLTFDDGPDPVSTPAILKILAEQNAKAVFFCNGERALNYPRLMENIRSAGHLVGNHTFSHSDGWRSCDEAYYEDVYKADECTSDVLFRPPYGHLRLSQFRALKKKYTIIFWDLMPYDFDTKIERSRILEKLKKRIRPGSIIVLHDSPETKVMEVLEEFLEDAKNNGYHFDSSLL